MTATLFDFDGVLVDSEPTHLAAFNDVLATHGLSITEQEYLETYMALDDAGVFRSILSRGGRTLREEEVRSLVAAKNPRFLTCHAATATAIVAAMMRTRNTNEHTRRSNVASSGGAVAELSIA